MKMPWDNRYKEGLKMVEEATYDEEDICNDCGETLDDCTCGDEESE